MSSTFQHDPVECQPNGEEGNYIMYQHATDASHPNNDRFSECSINDMRPILESKAHYCFTGKSSCWENLEDFRISMVSFSNLISHKIRSRLQVCNAFERSDPTNLDSSNRFRNSDGVISGNEDFCPCIVLSKFFNWLMKLNESKLLIRNK